MKTFSSKNTPNLGGGFWEGKSFIELPTLFLEGDFDFAELF